ncbi:MAG: outer membrane protein assembly factor BamD [Gammaproteobacteria bacterium]|nr:MAG: outer membrane protein assembly factor BamD [Gammaproteobacteria bacterium]
MPLRHCLLCLLAVVSVLLGACANNDEIDEAIPESELYETARKQIDSGNFTIAIRNLEALESRYPFGRYAEQAQLELIYAYYKSADNELAIAAADRFIRLHPQHPQLDYAYYMRGLAKYTINQGLIERFLPFDATERDPGPARDSFADFALLLQRFPNSDYAPDARLRMVYLRNLLARYEVNVANYYLKRKAWLAAANRARGVVENFPQTPAVPDALAISTQTYLILGMNDLAQNSLTLLRTNYPQHPALDENGEFIPQFTEDSTKKPWLEKLTFGLFGRPDAPEFDNRQETWLPPAETVPEPAR